MRDTSKRHSLRLACTALLLGLKNAWAGLGALALVATLGGPLAIAALLGLSALAFMHWHSTHPHATYVSYGEVEHDASQHLPRAAPTLSPAAPSPPPGSGPASNCRYTTAPVVHPPGSEAASAQAVGLLIDQRGPANPGKWLHDSNGAVQTIGGGPVLGVYFAPFAQTVSANMADAVAARMVATDASQDGPDGCAYRSILPDYVVHVDADRTLGVGSDPVTIISPASQRSIADMKASPSLHGFGQAWSLIAGWTAQGHPGGVAPIALIDPLFAIRVPTQRSGVHFDSQIRYFNGTLTRLTSDCEDTKSFLQGRCHGDLVAQVMAQDVIPIQVGGPVSGVPTPGGPVILTGGVVGNGVSDVSDAMPTSIYGQTAKLPIRRIMVPPDEFHLMTAIAYAGGTNYYSYLPPNGTTKVLTDEKIPGATLVPPLTPRPVVAVVAMGYWQPDLQPTNGPLPCQDPWVNQLLKQAREKGMTLVASAGNTSGSPTGNQSRSAPDHVFSHIPSDCSRVLGVGGYMRKTVDGSQQVGLDPNSMPPVGTRAILAPMRSMVWARGTQSTPQATVRMLEGTSVSAADVGGLVAMIKSLRPKVDESVSQLLLNSADPGMGQGDAQLRVLDPAAAASAALRRIAGSP